jgi:stress response protein YsnF
VVRERETLVDEPLLHDKVAITRVPIQRVVDGPVPVREEDGTTIISVVEEVLVVEKRWMLREEIHIRKQRVETHQPQRITLRSEEVQVERIPHADEDK